MITSRFYEIIYYIAYLVKIILVVIILNKIVIVIILNITNTLHLNIETYM